MSGRIKIIDRLRDKPLRVYWLVAAGFLVLHIFVFRDVVMAIPSILDGSSVIVREELVPFFRFDSQFWSDGTSALTASDEVRVAYSFWTAWVRHYKVLPFALVLLNTLSAFLLFYAFQRIGRYFYKNSLFGVASAALAALVIHVILLYAKLAHFYVLVIGFSMFALAISLACEQIFFIKDIKKRNIATVVLLVFLNPAIHYHVLFYVVFAVVVVAHLAFNWLLNRAHSGFYIKKNLVYFAIVTLTSLVPYVLMVSIITGSATQNVSTQIPVNYWMMYYSSLDLPFIFSMDTAGHLDLIRHGNYLTPVPRAASLVVLFLVAGLFTLKQWAGSHLAKKAFTLCMLLILLLSAWMIIGFASNSLISFHESLGKVTTFLTSGQTSTISRAISQSIIVFINILRFPHRFQLIYFYIAGVLLTISMVWMRDALAQKSGMKYVATAVVLLLVLGPLVADSDYRTALTSGDAAGFVAPYRVPDDLKNIKQKLNQSRNNKLFIMPTLESGREIVTNNERYSFLDKFLTYYLNQPTYYYGVGANTENKLLAYPVYRSISYEEDWWDDILAKNIGATHILVPKKIEPRELGITYLQDIDPKISASLSESELYKSVYEGEDYSLYELNQPANKSQKRLVDMEWSSLLKYLESDQFEQETANIYFPLQLNDFIKQQNTFVISDSLERTYYNIYSTSHQNKIFRPNASALPFANEFVASSNFTNIALSLTTLYSKQNQYNFLHENVPSLLGLRTPQFIGLTKGTRDLNIVLEVPQEGSYRVLLHGASKGQEIDAIMGGQKTRLQKIPDDRDLPGDYVDFTYFVADIELVKGKQTISISNSDQNAVLIESITLMPAADAPGSFESIDTSEFRFTPTDNSGLYELTVKGAVQ